MEKNHHISQKTYKKQQQKQQPIFQKSKETETEPLHLLEDGWFFGNSLHRTPKINRCYSEPAPSSRTTDMMLAGTNNNNSNNSSSPLKMSGDLQRRPSLPPNIWREEEDDWKENDDEDGPRMGDLIRQATMPRKQLSRLSSLPPAICKPEKPAAATTGQQQKMSKLTRRASLDPSLLLPPCPNPKHTCSSSKTSPKSTSSSRHHRGKSHHHYHHHNHPDPRSSNSAGTTPPHTPILRRTMSLTLSDQEVRGFRDLGFSFDKDELVNGISCLEIKESEEEENEDEEEHQNNNNHPSMSQVWTRATHGSSGWSNWTNTPTIPNWTIDSSKGSSSLSSTEDMKAQIKFWARAVASNVR